LDHNINFDILNVTAAERYPGRLVPADVQALLIGINYYNSPNALQGCVNDVRNLAPFLNQRYGFSYDDMVILTDDQQDPVSKPTRANIIKAMHWLVSGAQPNDSLFFHFSGHGGQTEDLDGDEEDGLDETIYPVDFKQSGHIVDDVLTSFEASLTIGHAYYPRETITSWVPPYCAL